MIGGHELDLFPASSLSADSCTKILFWWITGSSGKGSGLAFLGLSEGLAERLLWLSRRSSVTLLRLFFFFGLLLVTLGLFALDDLLLLSLTRLLDLLDLLDLLLRLVDEDL